jgi:hypothetical protein
MINGSARKVLKSRRSEEVVFADTDDGRIRVEARDYGITEGV